MLKSGIYLNSRRHARRKGHSLPRDSTDSAREPEQSLPCLFHHLLHRVRLAAEEIQVTAVHRRDRRCAHLQNRGRKARRAVAQRSRPQYRLAMLKRDRFSIGNARALSGYTAASPDPPAGHQTVRHIVALLLRY